jgi:hypothetical protein
MGFPVIAALPSSASRNQPTTSVTKRVAHPKEKECDADKSFLGPVTKTPPRSGRMVGQPGLRSATKPYFRRPY